MRLGITDEALLDLVVQYAANENLCDVTTEDTQAPVEPRIICSMGLALTAPIPVNTGDDQQ
ncbi:MAG: hypothetical protein KatS3mg040_0009 [Candidatus Kapaibacterium sp.]|nr:MAG: hypothetical protein KatS3mg040_0009 [Candidatus Kapabacteria bacterium]